MTATPPGKIILIHGASSSGKSTLAMAARDQLPDPFWHYSIDHLRDSGVLPKARFDRGDFAWADHRQRFFDGFHASVAAFAAAGNNLLVEHIFEEPHWFGLLARRFSAFDVFFVGLYCALPELIRREQARGDRRIGSARDDFTRIHDGLDYDLELQSEEGADANARRLVAAWRARTTPSAFQRALLPEGALA